MRAGLKPARLFPRSGTSWQRLSGRSPPRGPDIAPHSTCDP